MDTLSSYIYLKGINKRACNYLGLGQKCNESNNKLGNIVAKSGGGDVLYKSCSIPSLGSLPTYMEKR